MIRDAVDGVYGRWSFLLDRREWWGRIAGPRVFVVSVPKSGTNMLTHTLSLFPGLRRAPMDVHLPLAAQVARLRALWPGQVVSSHHPPAPELDACLEAEDLKLFFIYRDPRDVAVSNTYYIMRIREHERHEFYASLPGHDTRLMTTITGHNWPSQDPEAIVIPSIDHTFRRQRAWLDHPRCLPVRFEDLVGPDGGGDEDMQRQTVRRIARHLGMRLSAGEIERIANRVFNRETGTFRRGQIAGWRREFNDVHKDAFKRVAGELLVTWGYEEDLAW